MAYDSKSLDDYVDVAERIAAFYDKYPEGSLQPADPALPYHVVRVPATWCRQCIGRQVVKAGKDQWKRCGRCEGTGIRSAGEPDIDVFIVYTAAAYRDKDDPRPGVGIAWEPFPGQTPYTAGSEVMNAETSAWGRAIAALGIATKKGIASRQEVAQARDRQDGLPTNRDGSLSRSRTTDEEKAAAGVMTSQQQAEHTALRPERDRPAERITGQPPADEWTTEGQEDAPGTIQAAQRTAIMAGMAALGINAQQARLDKLTALLGGPMLLGGPVESTNDLSYAQAARVLEQLHRQASAGVAG